MLCMRTINLCCKKTVISQSKFRMRVFIPLDCLFVVAYVCMVRV